MAEKSPSLLILFLVIAGGFLLAGGALLLTEQGRGTRGDGPLAVARVLASGDGNCLVGAKHQHCYRLRLLVSPPKEKSYEATLDVLVEDRFAYRVAKDQLLWVVRENGSEVALDIESLAEPAPSPPDESATK